MAATRFRLARPAVSAVLLLSLASGCGRVTPVVTGTVTFRGQPLSGGLVTFRGSDGTRREAAVERDGSYRLTDPPVGPVTVAVADYVSPLAASRGSPAPGVPMPGNPPPPTRLSDRARAKYSERNSRLTREVADAAHQTIDLELTD
jgi:hypothetical protein